MLRYLVHRLLQTVPLLLLLSLLIFMLFQLVPGDYLSEMELNPALSPEVVRNLRHNYGLDRPLYVQYFKWLAATASGDLGYSFAQQRPVSRLILERLLNTAALTLAALAAILAVSVPLSVLSAGGSGWSNRVIQLLALLGLSVPPLLASLLLLYLAFSTGWFVLGGGAGLRFLILPATALAVPAIAFFVRNLRLELIESFRQPFLVAAVGKGLPPRRVLYHALRHALNPMISLTGVTFGGLLSGSVVVEKVFDWPGLGSLAVDSILSRDLFVVVSCILLSALMMIAANLGADLLLAWNDPRIREP